MIDVSDWAMERGIRLRTLVGKRILEDVLEPRNGGGGSLGGRIGVLLDHVAMALGTSGHREGVFTTPVEFETCDGVRTTDVVVRVGQDGDGGLSVAVDVA